MTEIVKRRIDAIAKQLRLDANDDGEVIRAVVVNIIENISGRSPVTIERYIGYLLADGTLKRTRANVGIYVVNGAGKDAKKD